MRSNEPQRIKPNVWYYEERKCIEIIHERKMDNHSEYDHIRIPYHRLRKTLARVDTPDPKEEE